MVVVEETWLIGLHGVYRSSKVPEYNYKGLEASRSGAPSSILPSRPVCLPTFLAAPDLKLLPVPQLFPAPSSHSTLHKALHKGQ